MVKVLSFKRTLLVEGQVIYLHAAKPPSMSSYGILLIKTEMTQINASLWVRRNWLVSNNLLSPDRAGRQTPAELLKYQAWEWFYLTWHIVLVKPGDDDIANMSQRGRAGWTSKLQLGKDGNAWGTGSPPGFSAPFPSAQIRVAEPKYIFQRGITVWSSGPYWSQLHPVCPPGTSLRTQREVMTHLPMHPTAGLILMPRNFPFQDKWSIWQRALIPWNYSPLWWGETAQVFDFS